MYKYRLKQILHSTITKVISLVLIVAFCLSGFLFYDFYKDLYTNITEKSKGYYWVYQGDKALRSGDLQNAIYCYEKGISHYPEHFRALYNLANIYVVYEDYHTALKNYEKALEIKPDYDVARIDYAIILSQVYQTDEAIEQYRKVLEYEPKHIKIPFLVDTKKSYTHNRGVAYYNMGAAYRTKSLLAGLNKRQSKKYLEEASKSYEDAVKILKSYNANYNLGLIYQLLKDENQAAYYYCRAIEIEPMEYEAHFNYAVLLSDMKEYTAAQEEFKKAGLLLDSKGDVNKTAYIYDVLSNVNQKIAINANNDYYKNINNTEKKTKYRAGKLVIDLDSKDNEHIKNFSKCAKRTNRS